MKVYVESFDVDISEMFTKEGFTVVNNYEEAKLFCFSGGDDVSPTLYGEVNTASHNSEKRDLHCVFLYLYAIRNNIPCVGICRGGQFLNVMNGGKMIQHYDGHGVGHKMFLPKRGKAIHVSSGHHQVMVPGPDSDVLGFTLFDSNAVEAVVYYNTNSLCYQSHPEWVAFNHECRRYFFDALKDCIKWEN